MNVRCPGCGATAEYSPTELKMICKHCGKIFFASEARGASSFKNAEKKPENLQQKLSKEEMRKRATIKMRHFHCSSCGAELLAKQTEATSYCYYCGQPAVMEEQLEDYLEPDYIIPFQITQEEAAQKLQESIRNGFYVPLCFKKFKVERLTPIYVPFWRIDMDYEDEQTWKYRERKSKYVYVDRFITGGGKVKLDRYTVDGSSKLEDMAGERIGPFDLSAMQPFDPAYLSGFYADRYDVGAEEVQEYAISSITKMYNAEMAEKMKGISTELYAYSPKYKVNKIDYILCPVWFLNIAVEGRVFTMLVNGQTGKVVYAIPPSKPRMKIAFVLWYLTMTVSYAFFIGSMMSSMFSESFDKDSSTVVAFFFSLLVFVPIFASIGCWKGAKKKNEEINRALYLLNGENHIKYVKDRGTDEFQG